MGQQNNSKRNASLDEHKGRAAGRQSRTGQSAPGREQIRDAAGLGHMKGKTSGAFGKTGRSNSASNEK